MGGQPMSEEGSDYESGYSSDDLEITTRRSRVVEEEEEEEGGLESDEEEEDDEEEIVSAESVEAQFTPSPVVDDPVYPVQREFVTVQEDGDKQMPRTLWKDDDAEERKPYRRYRGSKNRTNRGRPRNRRSRNRQGKPGAEGEQNNPSEDGKKEEKPREGNFQRKDRPNNKTPEEQTDGRPTRGSGSRGRGGKNTGRRRGKNNKRGGPNASNIHPSDSNRTRGQSNDPNKQKNRPVVRYSHMRKGNDSPTNSAGNPAESFGSNVQSPAAPGFYPDMGYHDGTVYFNPNGQAFYCIRGVYHPIESSKAPQQQQPAETRISKKPRSKIVITTADATPVSLDSFAQDASKVES